MRKKILLQLNNFIFLHHMKKIFFPLIFTSIILSGCTGTATPAPTNTTDYSAWNSYEGSNFSLKYPKDWTTDTSGTLWAKFFLYSPVEWANDPFKENVNLVTEDLSKKPMTLDEYAKASKTQIQKILKNVVILDEKKYTDSDGKEYYELHYTSGSDKLTLEFTQDYRIKDTTALIFTLTVQKWASNNFWEIGKQILASVHLD